MGDESLIEAIISLLSKSSAAMPPSQIRDNIKRDFPHLYSTERHKVGLAKGNYNSLDHALLNDIYAVVKRSSDFSLDRTVKPMLVSLVNSSYELLDSEEDYSSETGTVYILSTETFTSDGRKIIKIGYTTQPISTRITQLYTTGTPFVFKELKSWKVVDYVDLEQAIHKLLSPFRINRAREFFTEDALPIVEQIVAIHQDARNIR